MRFFSLFKYATAVAVIAAFTSQAQADNDTISEWTFETNTPADLSDSATGPTVAAETGPGSLFGLHASAATDWSTPSGNGSVNAYSSNNWAIGDYYQFQTNTTGFSDIGLWFDQASSGTGPKDFRIDYSLNGTTFDPIGLTYSLNTGSFSSGSVNTSLRYAFDLRQFGLEDQANLHFRLVMNTDACLSCADPGTVGTFGTSRIDNVRIVSNFVPPDPPPPPPPTDPARLPQPGDIVYGLNTSNAANTLELVSGPASQGAEVRRALNPWGGPGFIQSVEFDNHDGQLHNVRGNMLGVDFGNATNGGSIYSFGTNGTVPLPAGQLIGNTRLSPDNLGQSGNLTLTRLAGLSVSPDNSKIAVNGFDAGTVIVYDYTAGNTEGTGTPSLANGRQTPDNTTSQNIMTPGSTQGTAWRDSDTVLAFATFGALYEIDAATMTSGDPVAFVSTPSIGSNFTSLTYNPDVSNHVYALYSGFAAGTGSNFLYIFDPDNNYALVHDIDLSTSMGTASGREIALDEDGNLVIGSFGSGIHLVSAANLAAGVDNSSFLWYTSPTFSQFNGLDIGFGDPSGVAGDHNGDGMVDARDYVVWRKNPAAFGNEQGYTDWVANFGTGVSGSGGGELSGGNVAVPEPVSLSLLAIGLAALWCGRRRA